MDTWTQSMESSPDRKKYFSTIEWNKVNKQIEKNIQKKQIKTFLKLQLCIVSVCPEYVRKFKE